ncbi:ribosome maturation factor RimM [Clostridium ganghwense]|uniref:Ribosome maturation factor RimM n=1 Tax=Clostridium ganghwense TaxID=312089 RepID=A0ABT4CWI6_9CLOT|nr:ribosome maturation factor RimM [Clostridium ganghwense]MCY6372391.1 ribosome maturation factor RimM [Clostridium ganghwense]
MEQFLTVGKIINTHGLKGEVKVQSTTDDANRFKSLERAYIDGEEIRVVGCKFQPKKVIVKIEGVDSIEDAIKLKNKLIKVKREDAVQLDQDTYFEVDIVGCEVYEETGKKLGTVDEIIYTGSNDVYWVKGENEVLIPALKDIILNIDTNNKKIVIKPLDIWQ